MSRTWIRQTHRWVSIAFTAVSAAIFTMLAVDGQPAPWIYYLPLLPLAVLVISGLYMFVAPYTVRHGRRRGRASGAVAS